MAVNNAATRALFKRKLKGLYPDITILETENGASTLLDLIQQPIDIAILQNNLPVLSGIEVVEKYSQKYTSNVKFVLFSEARQIEFFQQAKALGFVAYLHSKNLENEIAECFDSVVKENCFVSESMTELIKKFGEISKKLASLSHTEKLFLNEIKDGKNVEEISNKLVLSSKSINQIQSSISKKLELPSKDQSLVEWTKENESIFS